MQARDVMTREVLTVGPETSAKYAGEVMAENGFAALPVVDDDDRLIGIVAEADVLRDRIPPDPRLHVLRDGTDGAAPALVVRGVMTEVVRSVEARTDVADVARLFVDDRLRSVPVVEGDRRVVGIISRRDVLHALVRPDDDIRRDLLHLVESYSGEAGAWEVTVTEGIAGIRRTSGVPDPSPQVEQRALRSLARTVAGVVGAQVVDGDDAVADHPAAADPAG